MRWNVVVLLVSLVTGCGGWRVQRHKQPLVIDPPSPAEVDACDLDLAALPEHRQTFTDRYGRTYTTATPGGADHPLVVTIEPNQGGPLTPTAGAPALAGAATSPDPTLDPDAPGEPTDPLEANLPGHLLFLRWPLFATGVTSLFGARLDPITAKQRFHYGVDMQGEYGQVVRAAAAGRVVDASWNHGHGRQVIIEHSGGWRTSYSHLAQHTVTRGQLIRAGQALGQLGNSGRSTGPHLHFEVTRWGSYFDPLDVLGTTVAID